jgi:hypothetical protein
MEKERTISSTQYPLYALEDGGLARSALTGYAEDEYPAGPSDPVHDRFHFTSRIKLNPIFITKHGSPHVRRMLIEVAHAISRTKVDSRL